MKSVFDKIKLSQLFTLWSILKESEIRDFSNVKRRYLERALSFEETLMLLEELQIVKATIDELLPSSLIVSDGSIDSFKSGFLMVLCSTKGAIRNELRAFLLNFRIEASKIFFVANDLEKIKFSGIRNLLIDLDFIFISDDYRTYFVNPQFSELFLKQISGRKLSPENLKKNQEERESIGLSAEEAVIDFEINRLDSISLNPKEIEHTALQNVLAGYDIKSFENYLDANLGRITRYIEVKAVSIENYKFYWSRNEFEIAKVLGENYCLYLLPAISSNIFDFDKMIIIRDPFKNVYLNEFEWKKEEESISFFRMPDKDL